MIEWLLFDDLITIKNSYELASHLSAELDTPVLLNLFNIMDENYNKSFLTYSKNGQVNQQASADRPVSSLFFFFFFYIILVITQKHNSINTQYNKNRYVNFENHGEYIG